MLHELAQSPMDLSTKILAGISLILIFFVAVALISAASRWAKRHYGIGQPPKPQKTAETPDPWVESAKRLKLPDHDKNE